RQNLIKMTSMSSPAALPDKMISHGCHFYKCYFFFVIIPKYKNMGYRYEAPNTPSFFGPLTSLSSRALFSATSTVARVMVFSFLLIFISCPFTVYRNPQFLTVKNG